MSKPLPRFPHQHQGRVTDWPAQGPCMLDRQSILAATCNLRDTAFHLGFDFLRHTCAQVLTSASLSDFVKMHLSLKRSMRGRGALTVLTRIETNIITVDER